LVVPRIFVLAEIDFEDKEEDRGSAMAVVLHNKPSKPSKPPTIFVGLGLGLDHDSVCCHRFHREEGNSGPKPFEAIHYRYY
jgi:hypothetical protein